jgi:hypothetical protein
MKPSFHSKCSGFDDHAVKEAAPPPVHKNVASANNPVLLPCLSGWKVFPWSAICELLAVTVFAANLLLTFKQSRAQLRAA